MSWWIGLLAYCVGFVWGMVFVEMLMGWGRERNG